MTDWILGLVFVSDDAGLIRDGHLNICFLIQDDALTTQAGFQPGIDGPVNEILLLVGNLLQILFARFDIHMAGTAGTNTTTVVIQMYTMVFGDLEKGIPGLDLIDGDFRDVRVLKSKGDNSHRWGALGTQGTKVPYIGSAIRMCPKKKPPSAETERGHPKNQLILHPEVFQVFWRECGLHILQASNLFGKSGVFPALDWPVFLVHGIIICRCLLSLKVNRFKEGRQKKLWDYNSGAVFQHCQDKSRGIWAGYIYPF
jgi:hypothetical protein